MSTSSADSLPPAPVPLPSWRQRIRTVGTHRWCRGRVHDLTQARRRATVPDGSSSSPSSPSSSTWDDRIRRVRQLTGWSQSTVTAVGFAAGMASCAFALLVLYPRRYNAVNWWFRLWRHELAGTKPLPGEILLRNPGFAVTFSQEAKGPTSASFFVSNRSLMRAVENRVTLPFTVDTRLPKAMRVSPTAFIGTPYDRGHLAPFSMMRWSEKCAASSFFMSNVTPQHPDLNRLLWKAIELRIRDWAKQHGKLAVCVGGAFNLTTSVSPRLTNCGVLVPSHFYVAVTICRRWNHPTIAFLVPNGPGVSGRHLEEYAMPVKVLEDIIKRPLFRQLPQCYRPMFFARARIDEKVWGIKPRPTMNGRR